MSGVSEPPSSGCMDRPAPPANKQIATSRERPRRSWQGHGGPSAEASVRLKPVAFLPFLGKSCLQSSPTGEQSPGLRLAGPCRDWRRERRGWPKGQDGQSVRPSLQQLHPWANSGSPHPRHVWVGDTHPTSRTWAAGSAQTWEQTFLLRLASLGDSHFLAEPGQQAASTSPVQPASSKGDLPN